MLGVVFKNSFLRVSGGCAYLLEPWKIMNIPLKVLLQLINCSCNIKNWKLGASHYRVWIVETSCERGHWKIIYAY